jgi:hypothetical protein
MTPLIVMGLLRIWVFSESVEFDMLEILWVIGRAMCPRMRVDMALSITKETQVSFCDVQQKSFFGSAILMLPFVTSAKIKNFSTRGIPENVEISGF